MKTLRKNYFLLVSGVILFCLLSACDVLAVTGSSPTPTPAPKSAKDLVQSSLIAMNGLKTDHVVSTATTQVSFATTSTKTIVKLVGDEVLPGQGSYTVTENTTSGSTVGGISFAEIVSSNKLYIQDQRGKWYVVDPSSVDFQGFLSNNKDASASTILMLARNATLTDLGEETLNGIKVRHITTVLSKNALTDQMKASFSSHEFDVPNPPSGADLNPLIDATKLSDQSLDLWIDNATSYLYRSTLKYTMHLDPSAILGTPTATATMPTASPSATSATEMSSIDDSMNDYSAFNKAVSLKTPANAVPGLNFGGTSE